VQAAKAKEDEISHQYLLVPSLVLI